MVENINLLQFNEQLLMNTFNNTKISNDKNIYEMTTYLKTQISVVATKNEEFDKLKQEMVCLKQTMHVKKTKMSESQRKVTVAIVLIEQHSSALNVCLFLPSLLIRTSLYFGFYRN